jgi:hypothetical protein
LNYITNLLYNFNNRQGFKAFRSGEKHKAQMLMRGRVFAQGFTVMAMVK